MKDDDIIRNEFPLLKNKIYFNTCSQGLLSNRVRNSVNEYMDSWNREGSPWELWLEKYEELKELAATSIGADKEEIAITFCASAAINSIASCLNYTTKNEVLIGDLEFPTVIYIWIAQAQRGALIRRVYARNHRIEPEQYRQKITDNTLIVPLTHLCYKNGYKAKVKEIAGIAHENKAYLFLDSYQIFGTEAINVKELDVDFFVSGALKYCLGSSGLAFLYVKKDIIKQLEPVYTGWFAQQNPFAFDMEKWEYASSARRFESGTPAIPSVYAALEGLKFLNEIGFTAIQEKIEHLSGYLIDGLRNLELKIYTPFEKELRGPLVVFESGNPEKIVNILLDEGIITSSRGKGIRIALHFYNTKEDADTLLKVLQKHRDEIG